jgi:glycosyltransferase involved in cell wall biosynthesis
MKSEIESLGIKARFRIVPNAVDTSLFFPTESQQTGEINRDKKYILLVALLTPIKGVPVLLKGLASLKNKREDFILDIVGDGPNRTEYEGLTRRLGLKDFVRFHGLRPKEEVAEFMKRCAFLVLPSHHETFGTVLVEALSCGKPVIATDRGGPKEIVSEDAGLLIPPDQPEVLVESIDYMLDHFPAYNPKKISEYAHSRYSLEAVGREWNRLYRNLTKNHV